MLGRNLKNLKYSNSLNSQTPYQESDRSLIERSSGQLMPASTIQPQMVHLPSSIPQVNDILEGGLKWGELSEWGSPWGHGGREVLIHFLSNLNSHDTDHSQWCLWIQGREGVNVYPPAWEAKGVDLKYIRFTKSLSPIRDLKPVFLTPFFKVIVLDCPERLSLEDCQFLGRQARRHGQAIILIRNFFLSPKKGNVWAKLRLNCWHHNISNQFYIKVIKGLSPRQIAFKLD